MHIHARKHFKSIYKFAHGHQKTLQTKTHTLKKIMKTHICSHNTFKHACKFWHTQSPSINILPTHIVCVYKGTHTNYDNHANLKKTKEAPTPLLTPTILHRWAIFFIQVPDDTTCNIIIRKCFWTYLFQWDLGMLPPYTSTHGQVVELQNCEYIISWTQHLISPPLYMFSDT